MVLVLLPWEGKRVFLHSNSGRKKKAHKHELFALVNVQMALGQTAGCPRLNRAKKLMCSPRNTGTINFSLWLTGGLSQGCPDFIKKFMCSKFMCLFLALLISKSGKVGQKTQGEPQDPSSRKLLDPSPPNSFDGRKRAFSTRTRACRNVRFKNTSVSKWFLDLLNNGRQRVGAF